MHNLIQILISPVRTAGDAMELRRLRRDLPNVHRRLISTPHGVRPEADTEYLDRLREVHAERFGD
jgi:hypothetical protein